MKPKKRKKEPHAYRRRVYRKLINTTGLVASQAQIKETDLHILADSDVAALAVDLILQYRAQLESYIAKNPQFSESLDPLQIDTIAPPLIREMLKAGQIAGVGPMAAVAGTIAEYVGHGLLSQGSKEVMVENGGDIFLKRNRDCSVAIFAGESPLSNRVGLRIEASQMPLGICTSSGTVGHSLSLGMADSVTVLSSCTALADAVATRLGNEVGSGSATGPGIARALDVARDMEGVIGVVVICGEQMGAIGDVELITVDLSEESVHGAG